MTTEKTTPKTKTKTTTAATRKAAPAAPVKKPFDLSQIAEREHYVWREIPREQGDPLKVKLRVLSIRMADRIPYTPTTPLADVFAAIAPYVAEWSLTAENQRTGEVIPVPPPAEAGWEVFEMLPNSEARAIISWLMHPSHMRAIQHQDAALQSAEPTPIRQEAS